MLWGGRSRTEQEDHVRLQHSNAILLLTLTLRPNSDSSEDQILGHSKLVLRCQGTGESYELEL